MKKKNHVLNAIVIFSLFVGCSQAQIKPGIGVDKYLLDAEEKNIFKDIGSREKLAKEGLFFSFEKGHVTTIMITSSKFVSKEGVRVGDNNKKIKKTPNSITDSKLQLEKGDKVLPTDLNIIILPGIRYIVKDEIITAILIVKE